MQVVPGHESSIRLAQLPSMLALCHQTVGTWCSPPALKAARSLSSCKPPQPNWIWGTHHHSVALLQEDLNFAVKAAHQAAPSHLHIQPIKPNQTALELFHALCGQGNERPAQPLGTRRARAGHATAAQGRDAVLLLPADFVLSDTSMAERIVHILEVRCHCLLTAHACVCV